MPPLKTLYGTAETSLYFRLLPSPPLITGSETIGQNSLAVLSGSENVISMNLQKREITHNKAEISEENLAHIAGGTGAPLGIDIDKAIDNPGERIIVITSPSGKETPLKMPKPPQ